MFNDKFEAVIGSGVAERYGLKLGDSMVTSHGLSEGGHAHDANPLVVVGILETTRTSYDNVIFTALETVWATHDHGTHDEDCPEEEHEHHGDVCAILLRCKSPGNVLEIHNQYKENGELLIVNPSEVLREVLDNVDMTTDIVYILCIIILVMNIFIISVITLLNMYDSKKEISLMRLIGIGMGKINLLYIIQNAIIGLISTLLALLCSRLCILMMGDYVASMGVVLNAAKIYPFEWVIMFIVFAISVLPTVLCTLKMSKQDGIAD
jgi:putative ABC transport system permease protein